MKILYFDCFSGISGDMTLGAFVDLGVDGEYLINEMKKVHLHGYEIVIGRAVKNGISATKVDVVEVITTHTHHHHIGLKEVNDLIDSSELNDNVKKISKAIFLRVANAEAKVHNVALYDVHFHEVGAVDSLVDIIGTAICIDYIKPDKIIASPMRDGCGFVKCQHGKIPVPVPATVEIFANRGVSLKICEIEGEMITPTGAAIVAELASEFTASPAIVPQKIGYGAGTKNFEIPNVLRLILGETGAEQNIYVLETNIDDTTAEILGYTMLKVMENGALDAFYTPIYMKKSRPAYMLSVLCEDYKKFEKIIFEETSTLGIRRYIADRTVLPREASTVDTIYGKAQVKIRTVNGEKQISPEYESAVELAKKSGLPLNDIYKIITK